MEFKSGRGGARQGAGSKRGPRGAYLSDEMRRARFQVRLPGYLIDWIRAQAESAGRIVERALIATYFAGRQLPINDKSISKPASDNGAERDGQK